MVKRLGAEGEFGSLRTAYPLEIPEADTEGAGLENLNSAELVAQGQLIGMAATTVPVHV